MPNLSAYAASDRDRGGSFKRRSQRFVLPSLPYPPSLPAPDILYRTNAFLFASPRPMQPRGCIWREKKWERKKKKPTSALDQLDKNSVMSARGEMAASRGGGSGRGGGVGAVRGRHLEAWTGVHHYSGAALWCGRPGGSRRAAAAS